jgi:hypothetical protein
MEKITRVGVDLTKNVMQLHAVDHTEHVVVSGRRHMLRYLDDETCRRSTLLQLNLGDGCRRLQ